MDNVCLRVFYTLRQRKIDPPAPGTVPIDVLVKLSKKQGWAVAAKIDRKLAASFGVPEPEKRTKPPRRRRVCRAEWRKKAQQWREEIKSGAVKNQAEIARREGISRARVCQIVGMPQRKRRKPAEAAPA
jgi:hypothetical protein